jgi:hypothetical protein
MPHGLTGAEAADRLAVHGDVGHDVDLGQPVDEAPARLLNRRPVEVAEAAAECDEILIAERLAADQKDLMVVPGSLERREPRRVEIFQVDVPYLGAERGSGRNHVDRLVGDAGDFALNA